MVTSASGATVSGKVRSMAPTVDPQTRNALVYVDLPNVSRQNAGLKAGMFARGEFQLGRTSALTVPQASVVPRDGFNYLLLLQPDNRVSQLKVETGRRVGDRVEITTALPGDARVVVQRRRLPERRRPGARGRDARGRRQARGRSRSQVKEQRS